MNFKITLKTNQSSRLEIIGCFLFFFFFLIASVAIAIVEKNIGMFFVILIFLPVVGAGENEFFGRPFINF